MQKEQIEPVLSVGDFLKRYRRTKLSKKNRPITLEGWATKLGYKSPRSIAMILKGQRLPSDEFLQKMAQTMPLTSKEKKTLKILVEIERYRKKKLDTTELVEELRELDQRNFEVFQIDLKQFFVISDWYHYVLRQLTQLNDFKWDKEWISKKLRRKITKSQIKKAAENLIELGLLEETKEGSLARTSKNLFISSKVPSSAIQEHHSQMLDRAKEALREQEVGNREFSSSTFCFEKKDLQHMKSEIREFREKLIETYSSEHGDSVYQLNFQLFEHTV